MSNVQKALESFTYPPAGKSAAFHYTKQALFALAGLIFVFVIDLAWFAVLMLVSAALAKGVSFLIGHWIIVAAQILWRFGVIALWMEEATWVIGCVYEPVPKFLAFVVSALWIVVLWFASGLLVQMFWPWA